MAIFEGVAFARNRGAPGTVITMESRMIGFVIAIALMLVIPYLAGPAARPAVLICASVYEAFTNAVAWRAARRREFDACRAPRLTASQG